MPVEQTPNGYKVEEKTIKGIYEARWSQTGSAAPAPVVVNRNTLGSEVVWTRVSTGRYRGTVTGITFGENTFIDVTQQFYDIGEVFTVMARKASDTTVEIFTQRMGEGLRDGIISNVNSCLSIRITSIN